MSSTPALSSLSRCCFFDAIGSNRTCFCRYRRLVICLDQVTMITVIITPLMMIGTWYGMNFHDLPELSWKHGYWVAAVIMVLSTGLTYWYFKKKKWF